MKMARQVAEIAHVMGDETRAGMLVALLEGRALTAGELARRAGVSAQTASGHLAKLMRAKLVVVAAAGRHRYYRLADPAVAAAIETLATLAPPPAATPAPRDGVDADIAFARTCYDHLAGRLGVALADAFVERGLLEQEERQFHVTDRGAEFLADFSIDVDSLKASRRSFARPCLDWTERRFHLAGALGKALLDHFLEVGWMIRAKRGRALYLTAKGRQMLSKKVGL